MPQQADRIAPGRTISAECLPSSLPAQNGLLIALPVSMVSIIGMASQVATMPDTMRQSINHDVNLRQGFEPCFEPCRVSSSWSSPPVVVLVKERAGCGSSLAIVGGACAPMRTYAHLAVFSRCASCARGCAPAHLRRRGVWGECVRALSGLRCAAAPPQWLILPFAILAHGVALR